MRKCHPCTRLRYIRLTQKRTRRAQIRYWTKRAMRNKVYRHIPLVLPKTISFAEDRRELVRVISKFHKKLEAGKKKFRFDFSNVEKVISNAMLLLLAEIKNAILAYPALILRSRPPRNPKVSQVLEQIGLADILGTPKVKPVDDDVIHWNHTQGNLVDGEEFDNVVKEHALTEQLSKKLYGGIIEAMKNSIHHAYIQPHKLVRKVIHKTTSWWMFTQEKDGKFQAVFCDLGNGIPNTLPEIHPNFYRKLKEKYGRCNDSLIIKKSIQLGKSRLRESHRGKGLHQIAEIVRQTPEARLTIMSNRGIFHIEDGNEHTFNSRLSINGTLINWELPLASEGE